MEKADEISGKRKDVTSVKHRACEKKQQTTSETSNLESVSSSYNTFSENDESKVNKRTRRINRFSDSICLERRDRPNMFGNADNGTRLLNVEEKSSLSSDECENSKVSVGNQKKEVGTSGDGVKLYKERSKSPEQSLEEEKTGNESETSLLNDNADDSDESDIVELDVKVCDICGDAGREDLLAICCKCPDGAEHIYCMNVTMDKPPEGDWVCEECRLDEVNNTLNTNRRKYSTETGVEKDQSSDPAVVKVSGKRRETGVENDQSSDPAVVKVSGKRRAEEFESSSSFKKQALETITDSMTDVDRGKVKSSHRSSSGPHFDDESTEGSHSPATRPRSQSMKGAFFKSNSFSFPNGRSKTKLVDEAVLQRQKSTKERSSHECREMGKSMSYKSANLGRFGPSGSKVKMLSPNSSHVPDIRSPKNKMERTFERTSSVKLSTSSSSALAPKVDKLLVSRGENNPVSSGSNSEAKFLKGDSKLISGLKSTNRSFNLGAEVSASQGSVNKHLPSSPTRVGTSSSSAINNVSEQKPISLKEDSSSKLAICKESTNLADGHKESSSSHLGPGLTPVTSGGSCQNNKQTGHSAQGSFGNNASAMRNSKEVKNRDNKLKDAIEAALLKKPGIYRKNKVSDQSDESSVATMNNEVVTVDSLPHSRNAANLTSAEVSTEWQGQILQNSNVDHSKQSNGRNLKQSMILSAEGKHLTIKVSSHDDVALSSLSKMKAIPDHECIWQGGFEINRSGKAAEFWDGLQAHLSMCASSRVFEAVNNLPHKILLNGVSRISAWPSQFEKSGVKEDNIAIYFFAKDVESYEKSYQVLLDDMIRGDLALIGSINGVELLIFPSNQLPEKSSRWNMVFFLWGVFRGKKRNSLQQVPNKPEKSSIPQVVSITPANKIPSAEDACSLGSMDKDGSVNSESQGNLKLQTSSQEKATNNISSPSDSVINVAPAVMDKNASVPYKSGSQDVLTSNRNLEIESKRCAFIDLSEDDDISTTNQINTWRDVSGRKAEEGNVSKKQKSDMFWQNSNLENVFNASEPKKTNNGESYFFPLIGSSVEPPKVKLALDLNEDISALVEETDDIIMTKKDEEHDVASSLSLSLAFPPPNKNEEKGNCHSAPSMVLFSDM